MAQSLVGEGRLSKHPMRAWRPSAAWIAPALVKWLAGALAVALCTAWASALAQAPAKPADEFFDYRIEPRDTLIGLHALLMRPEADWRVVQKLNRIADPHRLQPGSRLRIPISMLREEPANAEVLQLHGEVWIERAGPQRQPLAQATELRNGDVVITGAQSSVTLRFADGARAQVGPSGRLVLERHVRLGADSAVDTRLRLQEGGAEAEVPVPTRAKPAPRFELRTPAANLGVRGTEFRGRVDGTRTVAEVLRGRVVVGTRPLQAGFGTVASEAGVAPPRPLLAAPVWPEPLPRVERLPLQLPLGTVEGAVQYRAQVFDLGEVPSLLLEGVFEQPRAFWPDDLPDGGYQLRVRAADADGIEGRTATQPFVLKARPEPPIILRPRAGETLPETDVVLAWARNPQAARYRLQLATQPDFAEPLLKREDLEANELSVSLPPGTYHWRVASVRADGDTGPWSDARVLERIDPPPPPDGPSSQAPRPVSDGLVLSWSATTLPGVTYQVQVARDAEFTQIVLDERTELGELLWVGPEPGLYHVRVRAFGPDGRAGPFGSAQVVEVPRSMWWLWLLPLFLLLL